MSMQKTNKILVIAITRMGDLIQSIPFLRRLKMRTPESEVHLLVEECFRDVAGLLPAVDRIHSVKLEDLIPNLASGREHDLAGATKFYKEWVRGYRSEKYGEIWNLTHTRPSMVLNFLLAGERGRGVTLDEYGLQRVNSPWLLYFFATNLARPWCQFNLVDIYANCVSDVEWKSGRDLSFRHDIEMPLSQFPVVRPSTHRIAIHPGASQKSKQWPTSAYRQLAEILTRRSDIEVILVGGGRDREIAEAFRGLPRVSSAIGKTDVPHLASLLSTCSLLFSNDSGPMHVAAAVGVPVVAITVGSALGSETAPYGNGHLVLEPDSACFPCSPQHTCADTVCASRIPAETVAAVGLWRVGLAGAPNVDELSGTRVYQTGFSPTDDCLALTRLFARRNTERDELHQIIRPAWLSVLEDLPENGTRCRPGITAQITSFASHAEAISRELVDLSVQLENAANRLPNSLPLIERLARSVQNQEAVLRSALSCHGLLRSFYTYSMIARASLSGNDLRTQAAETAQIYRRVSRLLAPLSQNEETLSHHTTAKSRTEDCHEDLLEWR